MYESNSLLFKSRSVLGRLSASFKFVNDHIGLLLRVGGMALLPVSLLCGVYVAIMSSLASGGVAGWQVFVGGIVLLARLVLLCGFRSLLYVWLGQYADGKVCVEYSWKQLFEPMKRYAGRLLGAGVVSVVAVLACLAFCGGLFMLSPYTLIGTLPVVLFVLVPFAYLPAVYVFDGCSLGAALVKSFRRGVPTWGAMFAVSLVAWVVCSLIAIVGSLSAIVGSLAVIFSLADFSSEAVLPVYFPFLMFFFAVMAVWISSMAHSLVIVAGVFQYGSVEASQREWEEENQSL